MAHQGLLTTSGLLYEGSDYAAWREKMEAIVVMHYLDDGDDEDNYDYEYVAGYVDDKVDKEVAATIQNSVFKSLLHRLPDDIRDRPIQLIDHLEGLAKPLRFMKLPEVAKQRVYELV